MRTTGPVADTFLARLDAEEASRFSPLAVRSSQTRGRLVAEDPVRAAQPVPARPRPHRALQGVPPPQAQDAGLRRARGRPLPHAAHAHARGGRDLAHGRPRAAAQRGPDRGHRPRPRPRPPAVRPRRRVGARRARCASASSRGFRHNEHSLRVVDVLERDGRGLNLTHEVRDGILNHTGPIAPRVARGAHRQARRPRRVHQPRHRRRAARRRAAMPSELPAGPVALLGATGSTRIDALVHDLVETSDAAGDIARASRSARRCSALRAFLFERVYGQRAAARGGGAARGSSCAASSTTSATHPDGACGDDEPDADLADACHRPCRRHDRPLRACAASRSSACRTRWAGP